MSVTLHHGDCLDILPTLEAGSVDAVICDPPYGTTAQRRIAAAQQTPQQLAMEAA